MESAGIRALGLNWTSEKLTGYPVISRFVHDKDSRAIVVLDELKWKLTEFIDPAHAKKAVFRHLNTLFESDKKAMNEIIEQLRHWYDTLIYDPRYSDNLQLRQVQWKNATAHICGDHSLCQHRQQESPAPWARKDDLRLVGLLDKFLTDTWYMADDIQG